MHGPVHGLGHADELRPAPAVNDLRRGIYRRTGPVDESSQGQWRSSQSAGNHLLGGWAIAFWAAVHLDSGGGGAAIGSSRRRRDLSRNGSDGKLATDVTEAAAAGLFCEEMIRMGLVGGFKC